uniref:Plasmid stabilization system protein ParE n=1 Tax=Candidatus Kentrum sp. FW TaxID=2126338 RepID=A0A450SYB8_9GAMM|nr:MAG: Plasmid stabilization system protein ParE [Candidatus Kentron sp. FW]
MIKIILAEKAEKDLSEISKYIAIDNPIRAKAFVKELLKKSKDVISIFPLSCPICNESLNIRRFVYRRYNIYYQYDQISDTVTILHIIHSALLENTELENQ